MVHIYYGFEKFEKSGKCRIRMKNRIRNSGKKFFLKFFVFNCEQFLLNTFLSKMIINPKKVSFLPKKACFLHFSCTPHSSTDRRTDVVKFGYKIYKMAYSLTLRKSAHCFFPGKNRIRKIREKSGNEIFHI